MAKPDVYNVDCPSQSILALIGSKWSMLLLCALRAGPARTHALKRRLSGVSAKISVVMVRGYAPLGRGAAGRSTPGSAGCCNSILR